MEKFKRGLLWFFAQWLLVGSLVGLAWANAHHASYESVKHVLHFIVNDVLMVFFFAIAAKEIREAMLPGGSMSSVRTAALPLLATIGGMAGPALVFFLGAQLFDPSLTSGWAIPTATDIAFSALVARAIFGKKHPAITFLLLLAVADDAGGLIVLAVFYPVSSINPVPLALLGGLACLIAWFFRRGGVQKVYLYIVPVAIIWLGFWLGGIHPALSAVPLMWFMPHRQRDLGVFDEREEQYESGEDTLTHMEHVLKKPVDIILCLFGFVNAGVVFSSIGTGTVLVTAGLVLGKPLGIALFTWIGLLCKLRLPDDMSFRHVWILGVTAGIGFTVALFVSTVAFAPGSTQDAVKMGALFSIASAGVAYLTAKALKVKKVKEEQSAVAPTTPVVAQASKAA